MAKFIFQLEGVLRQRTNAEHQRRRQLALIQGQMTALQSELRDLDASRTAAEQDLRDNRLVGRLDLAFLAAHRRFALAMQRKALGIAQKMAVVQRQVEEATRNLAEASKRKKVIEKLRERQLERWRQEQSRREMAELDEIAMRMSHRNIAEAAAGRP